MKKKISLINLSLGAIIIIALVLLGYGGGQKLLASPASKSLAEKSYEELIEGAKKEGKVVIWDTTQGTEKRFFDEFKKKYPFIEVEHVLMRSADATERLIIEAQAGKKPSVDVFALSAQHVPELKGRGLLLAFPWARVFKIHPEAVDEDNQVVAEYGNMSIIAYNTKLLSPDKLPKTYEDLLRPEWKGKIGLEMRAKPWTHLVASGAWKEEKGIEFVKKILEQKPSFHKGGTELAQLLIAGEFPLANTYISKVPLFSKKGAPIDWVPLEPVAGTLYGRGIPKGAPHPHSAVLFTGWSATAEGQKSLEKTTGKSLPFPGLGTDLSKVLEGRRLALVNWGKSAERMGEIEDKMMNVWGIR